MFLQAVDIWLFVFLQAVDIWLFVFLQAVDVWFFVLLQAVDIWLFVFLQAVDIWLFVLLQAVDIWLFVLLQAVDIWLFCVVAGCGCLVLCVVAGCGYLVVCVLAGCGCLVVCVVAGCGYLVVCVVAGCGYLVVCVVAGCGYLVVCVVAGCGCLVVCVLAGCGCLVVLLQAVDIWFFVLLQAVDIWLSAALVLVVAALLEGAVVTMINDSNEERKRRVQDAGTSVSKVTPGAGQQISHQMEHAHRKQDDQHQREAVEETNMAPVGNTDVVAGRRIRLLSRALFLVLYLIFIVVYLFHFSPEEKKCKIRAFVLINLVIGLINLLYSSKFLAVFVAYYCDEQWRIQDFPEVGASTHDFVKFSPNPNCMKLKLKEFAYQGGMHPLHPLRSAYGEGRMCGLWWQSFL